MPGRRIAKYREEFSDRHSEGNVCLKDNLTEFIILYIMSKIIVAVFRKAQSLIDLQAAGIDHTLNSDMDFGGLVQCCFGSIGNDFGNLVALFEDAENDGFPTRTVPTFASDTFYTGIEFDEFYDTVARRRQYLLAKR